MPLPQNPDEYFSKPLTVYPMANLTRQTPEPPAAGELTAEQLLKLGCKELGWEFTESQLNRPQHIWINGNGLQLLSALRAAISADRAQRPQADISPSGTGELSAEQLLQMAADVIGYDNIDANEVESIPIWPDQLIAYGRKVEASIQSPPRLCDEDCHDVEGEIAALLLKHARGESQMGMGTSRVLRESAFGAAARDIFAAIVTYRARHPQAEQMAEALRRLRRWGGLIPHCPKSCRYASDVVVDVCDWIDDGMAGPLPPLPDYIVARQEKQSNG